jgi:hypothetical protein
LIILGILSILARPMFYFVALLFLCGVFVGFAMCAAMVNRPWRRLPPAENAEAAVRWRRRSRSRELEAAAMGPAMEMGQPVEKNA